MEYQARARDWALMEQHPAVTFSDAVPAYHEQNSTMNDSEVLQPPRKRRKGGKIFSGCNTCRVRKIKCDLHEPTCYNCEKSRRYICDGYKSTINTGMSDQTSEPSQISVTASADDRQAPTVQKRPSEGLTLTETVPDHFDGLDQSQVQLADLFNIFDTPISWPHSTMMSGSLDEEDAGITFPIALSRTRSPSQQGFQLNDQGDTQIPALQQHELQKTIVEADSRRPSTKPWMQSSIWNTMSSRMCNVSSDILIPEKILNSIPLPHIGGTDLSQHNRHLLQHYRTHVCEVMMPTTAPKLNPYLRLYLPLAVQGPDSLAKQALLHAILAVAAFNKAQLSPAQRQTYRDQAIDHHDQATSSINKNIATRRASPRSTGESAECKHALLAAALTLTTIEVFSGANEGRGYEYLLLSKTVIELTGGQGWWLSNPISITLLQIYQLLHIVGHTSGWFEISSSEVSEAEHETPLNILVQDPTEQPMIGHELLQTSNACTPEYTLDISFGISIKTLSYLHKIIVLSKVKSSLLPGQDWPSSAQKELVKLEQEMFMDIERSCLESSSSHSPSWEGVSEYVANEIKENHMLAFHYSTAVFFRRAICDGTRNIVPPLSSDIVQESSSALPTGQHLVSKALEHLENIDTLAGDLAIANTLWPGFIAAAEAVDWKLRRRALMWFGRAKRHGIGNITKAQALVQEIWRRVDRLMLKDHANHLELGPTDWRTVMSDMKMYIMLT